MKMMKKALFVVLTVAVIACVFAVCSVTGSAADIIASGECGKGGDSSCDGNKNISWTLDSDGLLVISGTGDMNFHQFECDHHCWLNLSYKIKSVVIEDGITSIGGGSFANCVNLANIKIPDSVTTIGYSAFSNCKMLTEIMLPDSVITIDYRAFYNCTGLTKINWNAKKFQILSLTAKYFQNVVLQMKEFLSYLEKELNIFRNFVLPEIKI